MFKKILIANRGEIACRIIKTAKRMGIKTVAVYSDADRNALFTEMADEAYYLGGPEPTDSYLKIDLIVDIAVRSNSDAIHPGYGFLSENAELPTRCKTSGIAFIGPPSSAIEAMGSKSEAKNIMRKANVPLVPGYHGEDQSLAALKSASEKVGYPQLIKASAGGGGKGMRVVTDAHNIETSILAAQREALSSFGDQRLLIEKYIEQPRHIEVQIFCDQHGNSVYLHDRDCSVQRRHQKIIEEAPAPGLTDETRSRMGQAAIDCAKSINYVGAGTVEFLLDKNHQFYFMEMNTRLQVEHPVTEMITQQDLVEWQLRVAHNEPLPLLQGEIPNVGHAFESRIYAEQPEKDFLPSTGTLLYLNQPKETNHLRIDTGVRQNDAISVFYDPMISKLVVWGDNRKLAARAMENALSKLHIAGIDTNCDFLKAVITHPSFLNEDVTTEFIEEHKKDLFRPAELSIESLITAAAIYIHSMTTAHQVEQSLREVARSPWEEKDFWHLNGTQVSHLNLYNKESPYHVCFSARNQQQFMIGYGDKSYQVEYSIHNNAITTIIDGKRSSARYVCIDHSIHLYHDSGTDVFLTPNPDHAEDEEENRGSLKAPLQGKIVSLEVAPNTFVTKGQPLIIIEAMKMEHTIVAIEDGQLTSYLCKHNDIVETGQQLIQFEPAVTSQSVKKDA